DVAGAVRRLAATHDVVEVETKGVARYFDAAHLRDAKAAVLQIIEEFHTAKPLLGGISANEILTKCPERSQPLVGIAIADLLRVKQVSVEDGLHRAASQNKEGDDVLARMTSRYSAAALAPPLDEVLRTELGLAPSAFRDALAVLKRAG